MVSRLFAVAILLGGIVVPIHFVFKAYRSFKELLRMNEELKNQQRTEKAKDGSLPWQR